MFWVCWMWWNNVRDVMNVRKWVRDLVNVRKSCRRCTESQKNWGELYWTSEFFGRDILNIRNALSVLNLIKLCYEREKMWKRCSECEKIMLEMNWMKKKLYWMSEYFERDIMKALKL